MDPLRDFRAGDYHAETLETKYYNPDVHRAAFALPNFMRANGPGDAE
jgi:spermidine synthase